LGVSPVHPIHRDLASFEALDLAGPIVLALGLVVTMRARGRLASRLAFALAAFVVLLLPVANLVPLYFEVQDRYLALPLLPLAFGLGALVEGSRERSAPRPS